MIEYERAKGRYVMTAEESWTIIENSEIKRLIAEMKLSFYGNDEGYGRFQPALVPLLSDVDVKRALHRPLPGSHNIWEQVQHLIVWKKYIAARLRNEEAEVTEEMEWQTTDNADVSAWENLRNKLVAVQNELVSAAEQLNDIDLMKSVEGGKIPRYFILHSIMHHDIHHGGQIAMLKEAEL